jgi:hypothetical protein
VRLAAASAFALTALLAPATAEADVSSWLAFGTGYTFQNYRTLNTFDHAGVFDYSMGVGSSPRAPVVIGGILRGVTNFTMGTDLTLALRGASGGFARGDWGFAIDAGIVGRWWGGDAYGDWPVETVLTLGGPWGAQLALGADYSSVSGGVPAKGFFAVFEIDLLRLTVMRQGTTDMWWPNPSPAGGRGEPR